MLLYNTAWSKKFMKHPIIKLNFKKIASGEVEMAEKP